MSLDPDDHEGYEQGQIERQDDRKPGDTGHEASVGIRGAQRHQPAGDSDTRNNEVMETSFTHLVGCRLPLQQAGMGGTATPELALSVTEAGALGMLGLAG